MSNGPVANGAGPLASESVVSSALARRQWNLDARMNAETEKLRILAKPEHARSCGEKHFLAVMAVCATERATGSETGDRKRARGSYDGN